VCAPDLLSRAADLDARSQLVFTNNRTEYNMQCFACFPDAQRDNPHMAHGMHLDNPAKLKDTGYIEHHPPRSCSPVSSCSEDSQYTSSSGSGSSDGGGYAADVSSWRVRDQVLISQQQEKPGKVSCSILLIQQGLIIAEP
jgi:hypothetical protein